MQHKGLLFSLFTLILVIMLAINFFVFVATDDVTQTPLSFSYVMKTISEMPSIALNFTEFNLIPNITADWGVFNFFKDFVNYLTDAISFIVYLVAQLILILLYVVTLIGKLFVGVSGVA